MKINKSYLYLIIMAFVLLACKETGYISSKDDVIAIINSKNKRIEFNIELAQTPEQRGKGLMHREKMSKKNAMLFIFDKPQMVGMWMKNTLIPLDMIFIDEDGVIKKIAKNNQPHDLTAVYSEYLVSAVLEINAGLSDRYNIEIGNVVKHKYFSKIN